MSSASFATTNSAPDRLIAGDYPITTRKVVIDTGVLARGSVLGQITANGKYILSLSGASDGSQVPRAILAEAVDATAADVEAIVYESGEFNDTEIVLGTAHTVASVREGLRDLNIYLRTPVAA